MNEKILNIAEVDFQNEDSYGISGLLILKD